MIGSLVGRLPGGMIPLSLLMSVRAEHLAWTGALAAMYLGAGAVSGPVLGRLIDRLGTQVVLPAANTVSALAMLCLAFGVINHAALAVGLILAAGAIAPPLDATTRALWPVTMPSRRHLHVVLALDTASQEMIYVMGPLAAAGITTAASARLAFIACALASTLGTVLIIRTPPARRRPVSPRYDWIGPLRSVRLRLVCLAMLCAGGPMGAITVVAVRAAARLDTASLSSVLPAALSVGAVTGGLAYGRRAWLTSPLVQLAWLASLFAAGWLLPLAASSATALTIATVAPGLVMAPMISAAYLSASTLAPAGHATETTALVTSSLGIGCALGTAAAGVFASDLFLPAAAAAAAVTAATASARPRSRPHHLAGGHHEHADSHNRSRSA
ncbi:MFS transporter [Streptomyces sp. 8L]|uniref:MFS transporter n=1 Tax=Streptomyces sp. 8L TaxID=2877242 RepID=UPI001CD7B1D0|nr:MFS transporter [Streptomyces sp. 8L]MCA1217361.1 MFS transporter [Streptomyces sp. 8L]